MSDDPMAVCCRKLANSQHIIETKNAEIAALKEAIRRLADQDATLSVQGGSVTVTLDATLTEAEHDALEFAVETGRVAIHDDDILRKLLERLNHDAVPEAIAGSDEARTDKAATSHRRDGTGDTLTLTDDEREAIELFATLAWTSIRWSEVEKKAATLRNLLERTK